GPNYNMALDDERAVAARKATDAAITRAPAASPRERAYIHALARRYGRRPTTDDRQALDRAYADAMRDVTKRYPDDLDAATLFAKSLMVLRPWDLSTLAGARQPAAGRHGGDRRDARSGARARPGTPGRQPLPHPRARGVAASRARAARGRHGDGHDAGGRAPRAHAVPHLHAHRTLRGRRGRQHA